MSRLKILLVLCCSANFAMGAPPQLLGQNFSSKEINSRESFKLECESERPVYWMYPQLTFSMEEEDVNYETVIDVSSTSSSSGLYHSVINVKKANYLDTGYYSCVVNGTSDVMDMENAASVYIYVKDPDELLVKNDTFIIHTATQYQPAVLPCRPTSLDVDVKLYKDDVEIPLGTQELDALNVTFDPKIGFVLDPVNDMNAGLYECKAELNSATSDLLIHLEVLSMCTIIYYLNLAMITAETHDVSFDPRVGFTVILYRLQDGGEFICKATRGFTEQELAIFVIINQHSEFIPKPSINNSVVHPVMEGEKLYLECLGLATKGIKFSIKWKIPNKSERVKEENPVPQRNCGKTTYDCHMKALVIRDVKRSDAGNYTCQVIDHNGVTNKETVEIKVHEPGKDYINLTYDAQRIEVMAGEPNVTWVIKVEAPHQPQFKWINQDGEDITNSQNTMNKYNMTVKNGYQRVILVINNIRIKDAGLYEFIAYYSNNVTTPLNLTLVVKDKPAVSFAGYIPLYYQLGKTYTIDCHVVGYPAPRVEWYFSDCDLFSECSAIDDQIIFQNVSSLEQENNLYISKLDWFVEKSGILTCKAENTEGNGMDSLSLFVTDIPDEHGLSIWGRPQQVVAGDTVKLYCGATKYNYSEDITWTVNREGYASNFPISNETDVQYIIRSESPYSYTSELTLINVTKGSDANYTCEARRKEDGIGDRRAEVIKVLDPIVPKIILSNMNGSDYFVSSSNSVRMYCHSKGLPVPTVRWFKDGSLLQNTSHISIEGDTLNIQFAKFEDDGEYKCEVSNRLGTISKNLHLKLDDKPGVSVGLVIGITVCVLVLIVMIIILILRIHKERKLREKLLVAGLANFEEGGLENINKELPVDDQAELLPYDKKWEFPRDKLKIGKQLGAGAFGVVMKAEAWGIVEGELKTTVAVKMVKRNAEYTYIRALASELKIMIHLGKHLNVVNLLGACTKNLAKMELHVIVEYCRFGNLHNYLLRHREEFVDQIDPKTGQIDPSIGMEILSRTESVKSRSKLTYASLSFSNSSAGRSNSGDMAVDYRAACAAHPGDRSPDPMGMDTEMNLICLTPTGEQDEFVLSNNSIQPEWRSNYRGDYKGARPICTRDLLCWAFQVARGMEYLASRKVMHGDLAARNILLADDNIVKICDFGLAKSMYKSDNYRKKGDGPLPVKWMAIESIRDRVFSTQSDVWSFGIVLWEFFSLARTPYPGMEADEKLYNKLVDGYRMEKPQYATTDMYSIMLKCWEAIPGRRPSFTELEDRLGNLLEESVRRHYIDLNDPYMDMNAQWLQGLDNDYLSMMNAPTYGNMVSPTSDDDDENEHQYVNSPHGTEMSADGGECSGYLCMKSPVPEEVIFSPTRRKEPNVFRFSPHLQNQRRTKNSEMNGIELQEQRPMLHGNRNSCDSDIEMENMEKGVNKKPGQQDGGPSELPSFANPTYQSVIPIIPSADNYVNMPQQKSANCDKLRQPSESLSTNTEFSDAFPSPDPTACERVKFSDSNPKNSLNSVKIPNAFSNPNYKSHIKTHNDSYVNVPSHNRKTSDTSSGFQSDAGESPVLVN